MPPLYTENEARSAVAASKSYAEALRRMGAASTGNGGKVLKKYVVTWGIDTSHFDPHAAMRARQRRLLVPLADVMREGSAYNRSSLKRRLYEEGLKSRTCEDCGQGEEWRGKRMALILDHVNGVSDDHRLENLRILCPNCAATLDTHCGRNTRSEPRPCEQCGSPMTGPAARRFCSRRCYGLARSAESFGLRPERRKVERPPLAQIVAEVEAEGWSAVGRRYGVSDNAVRKWVRNGRRAEAYAAQEAANADAPPPP